jgi:3',5'-cyclic-AMP phosphodiesterase
MLTMPQYTHIVQLSDLHIKQPGSLAYGRVDTALALQNAVQAVMGLRQSPDAVVITGDLKDFGRQQEYEHLKDLLAPLQFPLYLLPGNHDNLLTMQAVFDDHTYLKNNNGNYTAQIGPVQLIALNTVVQQQSHGSLDNTQLNWLSSQLSASASQPTLVAMHHPPFKTLIGHMDNVGLLEGAAELEAIADQHPQIQRIICGHLHRAISTRFGGTIASTAPAPCHQVSLDISLQAPSQFEIEPPAFALHVWDGQHLISHIAHIGQWAGPYAFYGEHGQIDSQMKNSNP